MLNKDIECYTFAADVWSLGMVMYEMITLKFPYYHEKFAGNATAEGKMPKIKDNHHKRYAQLIPLWESFTNISPEKRPTPSQALRTVEVILEEEELN